MSHLKVAFILEKSRLYFRNDLPVISVFFQLECRAVPDCVLNSYPDRLINLEYL